MAVDQFVSKVAGIPCIVEIDEYIRGSYSPQADSDIDFYGSVSFVVCDRRGRHAPWLEKKMTPRDESRILGEIEEYFKDQQDAWEAQRCDSWDD